MIPTFRKRRTDGRPTTAGACRHRARGWFCAVGAARVCSRAKTQDLAGDGLL